MKVNVDGTLSLPARTLTTAEVDQLIKDLAKLRHGMKPAVPDHPSQDTSAVVQPDPTFLVGKQGNGDITLGLRHEGLGWCVFWLKSDKAAQLRDFIAQNTPQHVGGLVNAKVSEPDKAH